MGSGNASPIYSPNHPGGIASSPFGMPGMPGMNTKSKNYNPSYHIGNIVKQSPNYSPNNHAGITPNSPAYSPMMQNTGGMSGMHGIPVSGHNSPAPGMYSVNSPNYSPQIN